MVPIVLLLMVIQWHCYVGGHVAMFGGVATVCYSYPWLIPCGILIDMATTRLGYGELGTMIFMVCCLVILQLFIAQVLTNWKVATLCWRSELMVITRV